MWPCSSTSTTIFGHARCCIPELSKVRKIPNRYNLIMATGVGKVSQLRRSKDVVMRELPRWGILVQTVGFGTPRHEFPEWVGTPRDKKGRIDLRPIDLWAVPYTYLTKCSTGPAQLWLWGVSDHLLAELSGWGLDRMRYTIAKGITELARQFVENKPLKIRIPRFDWCYRRAYHSVKARDAALWECEPSKRFGLYMARHAYKTLHKHPDTQYAYDSLGSEPCIELEDRWLLLALQNWRRIITAHMEVEAQT